MSSLLPTFFPYAPKECKIQSDEFFNCFSSKSIKSSEIDSEAGVRGQKECILLQQKYEKCMIAVERKRPPRRMRVKALPLLSKLVSVF